MLRPMVRFGLLALVPVVALGAVLAHELNVDVQQRYVESATASATLITQVGIQPLLNAQQLAAGLTGPDIAQIDEKLQGAAVSDQVLRIKVWNRLGTIVYSDNHSLIARTFSIDDDLGAALTGRPSASITNGHDEENTGDNLAGPVLQVYVPLILKGSATPSGAFEVYLPYAPVQAAIDRESRQLYLLLAAGLAVFYASMFPIVLLANRWRRRAETTALANVATLDRLNRMKSEFLVRISHQFRTAMVGIEGFSEVIRDSEQLDPSEMKVFAADIYSDAKRLDLAFNEIIDLDKMESGRAVLHMARANLNQLVDTVVTELRAEYPERTIFTSLEGSLPMVSCDEEKMSHALRHLAGNALKYSRGDVLITSRSDGGFVEISVKDSGPGMPPDFDSQLFVGRMNGGGGTGLGLPIARQIVEMHGGRMWFDSVSGKGTEFHFTVPVKAKQTAQVKVIART